MDIIYLDVNGTSEYVVEVDVDMVNGLIFDYQSSVIKNRKFIVIPKLATYVFWNSIFSRHCRVVTDSIQYPPAQSFWGRRIEEAFEKGYYIYSIEGKKIKFYKKI